MAVGALGLSMMPTLLPRPVWLQGLISGLIAAQAYAVGAVLRATARPVLRAVGSRLRWRPSDRVRRMADRGLFAALAALLLAALLVGHTGQVRLATTMGLSGPPVVHQAAAALPGLLIGAGLVFTMRAAARLCRWSMRRWTVWVLVPVLVLSTGFASGRPGHAGTGSQPAAGQLSWSSLGPEGQRFIRRGPDAIAIAAVTGLPARDPVRVYVGLAGAQTPAARAGHAVRELERSGGFDRAVLVVVVPTGSGWVNPAAMSALEYLYGGDVASVAVQYSAWPSWFTYLRGGTRAARASARALLEAVRARWTALPAQRRPRLLVYGESLGALGGMSAYTTVSRALDAAEPTDGALWVGVPAVADGAATARRLMFPRVRGLIHAEDPVAAWSLDLLL
jgi:uncharacterized membrane protein